MGDPLLYWKFIFFLQHFASFRGTFSFFIFYLFCLSDFATLPSSTYAGRCMKTSFTGDVWNDRDAPVPAEQTHRQVNGALSLQ